MLSTKGRLFISNDFVISRRRKCESATMQSSNETSTVDSRQAEEEDFTDLHARVIQKIDSARTGDILATISQIYRGLSRKKACNVKESSNDRGGNCKLFSGLDRGRLNVDPYYWGSL